jgi:glutamine synthetase
MVFALIKDRDGRGYMSDMRGRLKAFCDDLYSSQGITANIAVECEGFLFEGRDAEQSFIETAGFKLVSGSGYYNSLPKDPLKIFIDALAEAQRAMAFENEKDHPEVAPSQFELNYTFCDALLAADQVQLYKLTARQIAANSDMTASFLPKPIAGINGSGMHTNLSLSQKGKNIFYDPAGEESLSAGAWDFIDRLLNNANDICLTLNSSVNAYRRLDPNFEAPNQIRSSPVDRTSMVRIPLGNAKSARIEVRTVAPDANPYLAFLAILHTGLNGPKNDQQVAENRRSRTRFLPGSIYDAVRLCKASDYVTEMLGEMPREKFIERKVASADRCPKELGTLVKTGEVIFHHEVANQHIWKNF